MDFGRSARMLGVCYAGDDRRAYRGYHGTRPTPMGRIRGLEDWGTAMCSVTSGQVTTVLAADEYGRAAAWEKIFDGPAGSGRIQLWVDRDRPVVPGAGRSEEAEGTTGSAAHDVIALVFPWNWRSEPASTPRSHTAPRLHSAAQFHT